MSGMKTKFEDFQKDLANNIQQLVNWRLYVIEIDNDTSIESSGKLIVSFNKTINGKDAFFVTPVSRPGVVQHLVRRQRRKLAREAACTLDQETCFR